MPEWLQSPVVVFGLAIGAMFFGYFFGLFEGRGQGYKRRQEEEAETKKNEPTPVEPPPAAPDLPPDETPMLNVSKDKAGKLRLKLDGQRTDPSTLSTDQRKRLIEILTFIRPWLESPKPAQSPPPAQPKPARPSQEVRPTRASSPKPVSPPPSAGDDKSPAPAATSIVAQIDSILQAHIAGTPLVEKGVRLQESPEGGVLVWVGIEKYQGVEEVPDEQIKAAIRAAIAKWENSYTSGS